MIDLIEEGVDIAIRLGESLPPNVIARSIASAPRVLVAAPKYLKGKPKIRRPEDLIKHEYIRFAGLTSGNRMEFSNGTEKVVVATQGRYRVNSSLALRQCFLEGIGLGTAPAWLVQDMVEAGSLVRLLPKWKLPSQPVHLIYPSRKYQPLRSRTCPGAPAAASVWPTPPTNPCGIPSHTSNRAIRPICPFVAL